MKKLFKRFAASVLSAAMILTASVPAAAEEASESGLEAYIQMVAPHHFSALSLDSDYSVSKPIVLHDWETGENDEIIFIVTDNASQKMAGTITCVESAPGKYSSTFDLGGFDEIDTLIRENKPFQLGFSNSCFLLFDGTDFKVLENPESVEESFVKELTAAPDETAAYSVMEEDVKAFAGRNIVYSTKTGPPLVSNGTVKELDENGEEIEIQLCWAACVASKGRYESKKFPDMTATKLYRLCRDSNSSARPYGEGEEYPHGTLDWIHFAMSFVFGRTMKETEPMTDSEIANVLRDDKPIYCILSRDDASTRHAILLFQLHLLDNNNGSVYVFMDPGRPAGTISVHKTLEETTDPSTLHVASKNTYFYSTWDEALY